MYISLQKLSAVDNPCIETAQSNSYNAGSINELSPPIEYTIRGKLINPIVIGQPVTVHRSTRNDIVMPGIFQSSPVTKIESNKISTMNSVYLIEEVELTPEEQEIIGV